MREEATQPPPSEPIESSSSIRAWFTIGALTGWILSAILAGVPEVPGESGWLRWARVAAEHPVRTSLAFGALLAAACGSWRRSAPSPPEFGD